MTPQIRKLEETVEALRAKNATYFPIMRLTGLKRLSADPDMAARFVFHLAGCVHRKVRGAPPARYTKLADWKRYQAVIAKAMSLMRKHLKVPGAETLEPLYDIRVQAEEVQGYTGRRIWGSAIRSIHSRDVLVIEDALNGILQPESSAYWAYKTARDYAERYNSRYGTGLVLESIPALEDILRFWRQHEPSVKPVAAPSDHPHRPKNKRRAVGATLKQPTHVHQAQVFEQVYPQTAEWIQSRGWIEVGYNDMQPSMVRALDLGGMVWEGKTQYGSLDALWRDLEGGIAHWIAENVG